MCSPVEDWYYLKGSDIFELILNITSTKLNLLNPTGTSKPSLMDKYSPKSPYYKLVPCNGKLGIDETCLSDLCAFKNPMLGTCPRCYPFVDGTCFHTLIAALATTLASISISTYISKYLWLQRLGVYVAIVHSLFPVCYIGRDSLNGK